eukprot:NODE_19001_length_864_cov_8.812754.p1 GENE.NODE_19001_length_864_cov_8.812754~~NODE_19001_length_864_cov_8.812754.p1  ORF type:complete len:190 (+),score=17.70 NODE_19001_length_864_cov_8.812754:149-718(+)
MGETDSLVLLWVMRICKGECINPTLRAEKQLEEAPRRVVSKTCLNNASACMSMSRDSMLLTLQDGSKLDVSSITDEQMHLLHQLRHGMDLMHISIHGKPPDVIFCQLTEDLESLAIKLDDSSPTIQYPFVTLRRLTHIYENRAKSHIIAIEFWCRKLHMCFDVQDDALRFMACLEVLVKRMKMRNRHGC